MMTVVYMLYLYVDNKQIFEFEFNTVTCATLDSTQVDLDVA